MNLNSSIKDRFVVVEADSLNGLAARLNKISSDTWFTVVTISGTSALIDMSVHLMVPVDQSMFLDMEDEHETALQGDDNSFKQNLIA